MLNGCQALTTLGASAKNEEIAPADVAPMVDQCKKLVCEFPPLLPSRRDTQATIDEAQRALKRWEAICGRLP
jgi:hypothetical protein